VIQLTVTEQHLNRALEAKKRRDDLAKFRRENSERDYPRGPVELNCESCPISQAGREHFKSKVSTSWRGSNEEPIQIRVTSPDYENQEIYVAGEDAAEIVCLFDGKAFNELRKFLPRTIEFIKI
jgi:hypothetical protein